MSLCCITGEGGRKATFIVTIIIIVTIVTIMIIVLGQYLLQEILHATVLSCKHLRGIIIVIVAITITIIIIMIMTIIMVISRGLF